ncbi:MAG TPA: prepilin peptidase [Candidatus Peribacteraceae bacterium]|nr:prepilin peptidase [Candidatus Peribacteraceae bacterium]
MIPLQAEALIGGFLFVLGAAFGSFGNVLILRMPKNESVNGRSHCPHCGHILSAWELIPILSFLFLRGRCKSCGKPIAWQYPLVELVAGLFFVLAGWWSNFLVPESILLGLVFWAMLLIAMIDARTQMIPDAFTVILLICAVAYRLLLHSLAFDGALVALVFFGGQWLLSRGQWVGSGDVFLAVALGFLLGSWVHLLLGLMAAYIIGALYVSVLLGLGTMKRSQHVAFGPFLVMGALIAFLYGDKALKVLLPM